MAAPVIGYLIRAFQIAEVASTRGLVAKTWNLSKRKLSQKYLWSLTKSEKGIAYLEKIYQNNLEKSDQRKIDKKEKKIKRNIKLKLKNKKVTNKTISKSKKASVDLISNKDQEKLDTGISKKTLIIAAIKRKFSDEKLKQFKEHVLDVVNRMFSEPEDQWEYTPDELLGYIEGYNVEEVIDFFKFSFVYYL